MVHHVRLKLVGRLAWGFGALGLVAAGCGGGGGSSVSVPPSGQQFAYTTDQGSSAISGYMVNLGGQLTPLATPTFASGGAPSSIAATPTGKFLYVGNLTGTITQYQIGADGTLSPLSPPSVAAAYGPQTLTLARNGKFVFALGENNVVAGYSIGADGTLTLVGTTAPFAGPGEPTGLVFSASGKQAYVVGNGVAAFTTSPNGTLTPLASPGLPSFNARGATIDASGRFLYVSNPSQNAIMQFAIQANGSLTALATPKITVTNAPTQMVTTATGAIYTAGNSIGEYTVGANGTLLPIGPGMVGGATTTIAPTPDGSFVYGVNVNGSSTNAVQQYSMGGNGGLTALGAPSTITGVGPLGMVVIHK